VIELFNKQTGAAVRKILSPACIVHGKIAFERKSADELNNNDLIRKLYLGL
jgi:branched-chain amino acid transport system ATP-binding protein